MDARVTPLCLDVKDEMNGIAALDVHPHWRYVSDTGGRRPGADAGLCVSIHALRKEGDPKELYDLLDEMIFLSTPSARRATAARARSAQHTRISIHALREEGDR